MPKNNRPVTTYESMHKHLKRKLGSANKQTCVDCGNPAEHWSLSNRAEDVLIQDGGRSSGRPYSLNKEDYDPRCAKCHSAYDSRHGLQRSPTGVKTGARKLCAVEDCFRPHHAQGDCELHYRRKRREAKRNERSE